MVGNNVVGREGAAETVRQLEERAAKSDQTEQLLAIIDAAREENP